MVAWRIGIVALTLTGIGCSVSALADEARQGPPATVNELPIQPGAQLAFPLALWPACSSAERLARVEPICFSADDAGIGLMNQFLHLLRSTEGDIERMCDVDTRIVRSLQSCSSSGSSPTASEPVLPASWYDGFVVTMAQQWRKQGQLRRADELYRYYFEGFVDSQPHEAYFGEWASTKLALGEWDTAKELARRYVAYNRDLYECGRSFLPSLVIALELQVDILETVEDHEQVAQARKELEKYSAIADTRCFGGSCYGCIEGVCRGSPGFAGSCSRRVTGMGKE